MRTRKVTTAASTTTTAPERFLVIALVAKTGGRPGLLGHLVCFRCGEWLRRWGLTKGGYKREYFFISHHHSPPDSGYAGDDDGSDDDVVSYTEMDMDSISYNRHLHTRFPTSSDDTASLASVVIRKYPPTFQSSPSPQQPETPRIPAEIIAATAAFAADVCISTEIRRYLRDIVVFLRMHRAVRGGVTAQATVDFELLVRYLFPPSSLPPPRFPVLSSENRCLAPLHNLDFATPALVSLAAFKVYAHRIALVTTAADERSTLWGSSKHAVETYLAKLDVEAVIEDVLAGVKAPV